MKKKTPKQLLKELLTFNKRNKKVKTKPYKATPYKKPNESCHCGEKGVWSDTGLCDTCSFNMI